MIIDNFHTFSFDGIKLSSLGAVIAQRPTLPQAERDFSLISAPFRSGDLIEDNGRYKNIDFSIKVRTLPAFCDLTAEHFSQQLAAWLKSDGYKVYRDTYAQGYFRYAVCKSISAVVAVMKNVYEATIHFSFQPFLYRDGADVPQQFSSTANWLTFTLTNPENCEALPIIKIIGTGEYQININSVRYMTANVTTSMTIDKIRENVFDASGNPCNDKVSGLRIPALVAGDNEFSIVRTDAQGIQVEVTPNWRRL